MSIIKQTTGNFFGMLTLFLKKKKVVVIERKFYALNDLIGKIPKSMQKFPAWNESAFSNQVFQLLSFWKMEWLSESMKILPISLKINFVKGCIPLLHYLGDGGSIKMRTDANKIKESHVNGKRKHNVFLNSVLQNELRNKFLRG